MAEVKRDPALVLPTASVARAFGISAIAFRNWEVFPCEKKGKTNYYYLPEVIEYRLTSHGRGQVKKSETEKKTITEETLRLTKAKADKAELEAKQAAGTLVLIEEEERRIIEHIMAARSRLLALPSKLAAAAIGMQTQREIEQAAKKMVNESLTALADMEKDRG